MVKVADFGGLTAETLTWIASVLGGPVTSCERIPGGASRLSYRLSLADSAQVREAFLRVDSGEGPLSDTIFTLEREITAMRSLSRTAVRLPQIYAFNPDLRAVLMENMPGTSDIFSVSDSERLKLQKELLTQLALLHQAPVNLNEAFGCEAPETIKAALEAEVSLWSALYHKHVGEPEPAISFALDWLRRAAPGSDRPPVLVHGDVGPGNFLFQDSTINALIDWELVHAGHPLEDLACIIARSLGVPFGDLRQHVATYGELIGQPVDSAELDYCVVLVLTRYCVGISMGLAKTSLAIDVPVLVKFLQVNLLALVRIIAQLSDIPPADVRSLPLLPAFPHSLYDFATGFLNSDIKPAVAERFLIARLEGLSGLLSYLRNLSDYGSDRLRSEELMALRHVLGREVATVHEGRSALPNALSNSSAQDRLGMLRWLVQRVEQHELLMKEMLGTMYDRTLVYR